MRSFEHLCICISDAIAQRPQPFAEPPSFQQRFTAQVERPTSNLLPSILKAAREQHNATVCRWRTCIPVHIRDKARRTPVRRILSRLATVTVISLGLASRRTSLRHMLVPPGRRALDERERSSGLAPGGVYPRPRHREAPCALTARFHPYRDVAATAVCFCGTFLRVAPTGRYPAPCPMEPGRSSTLARRDGPASSATRILTHDGARCNRRHGRQISVN